MNAKAQKAMKAAVYGSATRLMNVNGRVTTLEVKTDLRIKLPHYFWNQKTVSNFMDQLYNDGKFNFTDNGQYRIYTSNQGGVIVATPVQTTPTKVITSKNSTKNSLPIAQTVDKQKALDLVKQGPFIRATVFFKNGPVKQATVDAAIIKAQKKSPFGYLQSKKIHSIVVGNEIYLVQ
jgi:TolA-binding protein